MESLAARMMAERTEQTAGEGILMNKNKKLIWASPIMHTADNRSTAEVTVCQARNSTGREGKSEGIKLEDLLGQDGEHERQTERGREHWERLSCCSGRVTKGGD